MKLVAVAVIVIAVAQPVESAGVQSVTPTVLQQSVAVSVRRVFGVPVEIAPQQPQRLAADLDAKIAHASHVGRLVRMHNGDLCLVGGFVRDELQLFGTRRFVSDLQIQREQVTLLPILRASAGVAAVDRQHILRQRHQRRPDVDQIRRIGQRPGGGPTAAVVANRVAIPRFASADFAWFRMAAKQQPQSTAIVANQPRQAFVAHEVFSKNLFEPLGRTQQFAIFVKTLHLDCAINVQTVAWVDFAAIPSPFDRNRIVLAPLFVAFLVGDPTPTFGIARQTGTSLEPGRTGHGHRLWLVADYLQPHVVVAFVVSVPGDEHIATCIGGDRGAPFVCLRIRNDLCELDRTVFANRSHMNIEVILAPALPSQPDGPV